MDVEKTMQFIIEQQAQFSADIQVLKEQTAALSAEMQKLHLAQLRQLETVNRLLDVTTQQGEGIHRLTLAQERTENNLNALILVVDGLARRQ